MTLCKGNVAQMCEASKQVFVGVIDETQSLFIKPLFILVKLVARRFYNVSISILFIPVVLTCADACNKIKDESV